MIHKQLLILVSLGLGAQAWGQSTTQPAPPSFVIGVWQQPVENFAAWQARGVNSLVQIPTPASAHPPAAWVAAAEQAGLWQIRIPVAANLTTDATPHLLAYAQPDEPEDGSATAAQCAANYAAWKVAQPKIPVYCGFDGSRVLGLQGGLTQANYLPYLATADEFGSDMYPVTCWGQTALSWLQYPGGAATKLASWKPSTQFVCIECSNQKIGPSQLATTAQIRYQAWHAVVCGARGIVWFPEQFNPFNFDATTPAIAAEITRDNADLMAVAPYLAEAKPLIGIAGYEGLTNATGNFTLLINQTDAVTNYGGVQIAPYGAYAIANGQVIVHTLLPLTPDQAADQRVNDQAAQAATQTQLNSLLSELRNIAQMLSGN
jgi:hypothetical protein